ncbi:hypothetical protein CEXT_240601 [Caerostris extrusa]|uniref:Uncharacterized protein n=1 Tax=Caerostris extrusa TaxID=172846 RepID=A0AAV4QIK4_CAEEX|nr:hypothetical protein CEXT_240601 [Caerostris extrusa]
MDVIRFGRQDYQSECGTGELSPCVFLCKGYVLQKKNHINLSTSSTIIKPLRSKITAIDFDLGRARFIMVEERRVSVTSAFQQSVIVRNADYSVILFCFRCIYMDETVGWLARLA